jgi:hypothetical protein
MRNLTPSWEVNHMSKQLSVVQRCSAAVLLVGALAFGLAANAQDAQFVTFDVPASQGNGTIPIALNSGGTVTGWYFDANHVGHGFLRYADGTITPFDAPGAGTNPNTFGGTFPSGINLQGSVAGYINDENGVSHGFVRTSDGNFTGFDAPGADVNPADQRGTLVTGINDLGAISGFYVDTAGVAHGFRLKPNGNFTSFQVPGAAGTIADGPLNLEGSIVGFDQDFNSQFHAFVRNPGGKLTSFDPPGMCTGGTSVGCFGGGGYDINIFGTSVGAYMDDSGSFVSHQFLRRVDGSITSWEAPGAGNGLYQGTGFNDLSGVGGLYPVGSLNNAEAVTSIYVDADYTFHGYVRTPDGQFTTIDAPGADITPGDFAGTSPTTINDSGVIAGWYVDSSFAIHGFVRIP